MWCLWHLTGKNIYTQIFVCEAGQPNRQTVNIIFPNPSFVDMNVIPNPSFVDINMTPIPFFVDINKTPIPFFVDINMTPIPFFVDINKTPIPSFVDINKTPNPSFVDINKTPNPSFVDINVIPNPSCVDINVIPNPSFVDVNMTNDDMTHMIWRTVICRTQLQLLSLEPGSIRLASKRFRLYLLWDCLEINKIWNLCIHTSQKKLTYNFITYKL